MSEVTNPFQACNNIFFKPNGVFQAIDEKNNWSWIPFFVVVAMSILPAYLFISHIDFEWYKNLIIDTQYGDLSPAERDMYRDTMSQPQMMIMMVVGGIIGPIIFNAILALYLNLMTKSCEKNLNGYTDWYGFTWWAGMPIVVGAVIGMLLIALSDDHQVQPSIVNPLSVAYLFNVTMDSDWFGFAQSIRLESLWSIYLITVGISQWTSFSTQKSALIAAAPFVIILAIWGVVKLI